MSGPSKTECRTFADPRTNAYVGHIERATKNPTIKTVEKIAVALECSVCELFADIEEGQAEYATLSPGRKSKNDTTFKSEGLK